MHASVMETPRLWLRQLIVEDLDLLHLLWNHPKIRRFLWDDQFISRETAEATLMQCIQGYADNGFGIYAMIHKASGDLIGFCGLRPMDEIAEIELLYGVAPEYWRQGLTTEAVKAVLTYSFELGALKRVIGMANPANIPSWRVMENVGMTCQTRLHYHGEEMLYYTLSRDEFRQFTASEVK